MVGLRPPSIKGVLRFWYRAVALALLKRWESVRKSEQDLFGSTKGQAKVLMHLRELEKSAIQTAGKRFESGTGYLGYGLIDRNGRTLRPYLKPGFSFALRLVIRNGVDDVSLNLLKKALMAMGLFGGLGARSRKGFGSLTVERLAVGDNEWTGPQTIDEYSDVTRRLLAESGTYADLPPYSAFSAQSRVCVVGAGKSAYMLFEDVGRKLLRYRSYGHQRGGSHQLPWGEKAAQRFKADHDLVADFLQGGEPTEHPQRVAFGLPHNYFFSTELQAGVNGKIHKRRASPLFIHIHSFGDHAHATILTLLPAQFLPEDDCIEISTGRRKLSMPVNVNHYRIIHDFMDWFPPRDRVEVWPG